jgi:hypothetical protein
MRARSEVVLMSQPSRSPVVGAFRLATATAVVAVGDAAITIVDRQQFVRSVTEHGWAIGGPPYDGTLQRLTFCIAVAVLVAAVGIAAAALLTRPRPGARLTVIYSLPACVVIDLFTVVYSPDNIGSQTRDESAAGHAEAAVAFEHLFPLWYTGGHAVAIGLLAALTLRLLIVLHRPGVRDFYEYPDPGAQPVLRWGRRPPPTPTRDSRRSQDMRRTRRDRTLSLLIARRPSATASHMPAARAG